MGQCNIVGDGEEILRVERLEKSWFDGSVHGGENETLGREQLYVKKSFYE